MITNKMSPSFNLIILIIIIKRQTISATDNDNINNTYNENNTENALDLRNCRERHRLIQTEKGDLYKLIDAIIDQKLILQCHYCKENDDNEAKNWYKIKNYDNMTMRELKLDMNNDAKRNRIIETNDHNLIINNFTQNDTGMYACRRLVPNIIGERFNYLVDSIYTENITKETGNLSLWLEYHNDYFMPLNRDFNDSQLEDFVYLRSILKLHLELITDWDEWTICQVCGRPENQAIKTRLGFCRIKITNIGTAKKRLTNDESILSHAFLISCFSRTLGNLVPDISRRTRVLPNFEQQLSCKGVCNPDAEGGTHGWKAGKTSSFKYRKMMTINEDTFVSLTCPEATLENTVVWKQNSKVIEPGIAVDPKHPEQDLRVYVDTFNTLYFSGIKEDDEGNYTCQMDDIRMQHLRIFVVRKSQILTDTFIRHLVYLGFILALIIPCYFAGVIIACSRKRFFKDYEELKDDEKEKRKRQYI